MNTDSTTIRPITFTRFLRDLHDRQDALGDFARDWTADRHMSRPRGAYDWPAVERFLVNRHASLNAIEAAHMAWKQWKKVQKRQKNWTGWTGLI